MATVETRRSWPPFGQLGGPGQRAWVLSVGVDPLDLRSHRGKDLLLIAQPGTSAGGYNLGIFGPFGSRPYPEGGSWSWSGASTTLYVAATTGRSSSNTDTPASTFVPGRLAPSLNFGQSLFTGADPTRVSGPAQGQVVLIDPDDKLEYLLDYIWDGAPLIVKRGDRGTPFSTWETVGRFNAAAILSDLDQKRIVMRDLGWQLSGPLHAEYYHGTGGLDGDATLNGRWKPYAVGYCWNTEPALISTTSQIFQSSFTPITSVIAFRHGGVALPFSADYATYDALAAATIPAGYYATCLAQGLTRPNVTLQYGVRVDLCGDATTAYGHSAPTTRAAIARRIATAYGPNRVDDNAQIDGTAFSTVEARHSALCGWYWSDIVSKADALNEVMAGILGWWRVRSDGVLTVGYLDDPARGSILNIPYKSNGMSRPRVVATMTPRAGTLVSWRRNYGTQGRSELAPSVSDSDAALYAQAARYAQALSPHISARYPTAQIVPISGNFWNEADAIVEAGRQQGLLEVERKRWQWEMTIDPYLDFLGKGATLTGFNRLRAGPSLPLICVSMDTPGTDTTTFDWWG